MPYAWLAFEIAKIGSRNSFQPQQWSPDERKQFGKSPVSGSVRNRSGAANNRRVSISGNPQIPNPDSEQSHFSSCVGHYHHTFDHSPNISSWCTLNFVHESSHTVNAMKAALESEELFPFPLKSRERNCEKHIMVRKTENRNCHETSLTYFFSWAKRTYTRIDRST
jgi:hypothetical protein